MIIHSVRLKNIKSFGEGPDGDGVTLPLHPGTTRIAGRNGHGKSTVIEAIGYALFLAAPEYGISVKANTYLLRDGASTGEIDLTFSHRGDAYRVERTIGTATRRLAKIIDLADDSICAEGVTELRDFIGRLLDIPDPKLLGPLFSHLIGVGQGRLNHPFDTPAAAAKSHFEPLLDVAIFRACFEKLRPAATLLNHRCTDLEHQADRLRDRLADRADSASALRELDTRLTQLRDDLHQTTTDLHAAKEQQTQHTQHQATATAAETAFRDAKAALHAADLQLSQAQDRLAESTAATETQAQHLAAHKAYLAAESTLKALARQRDTRDALLLQRQNRSDQQATLTAQLQSHSTTAETARKRLQQLTQRLAADQQTQQTRQARLAESEAPHQTATQNNANLRNAATRLQTHANALPALLKTHQKTIARLTHLETQLADWNPEALPAAQRQRDATREEAITANETYNRLKTQRDTLAGQLKSIADGTCPLLLEPCQQFNPGKVRADLQRIDTATEDARLLDEHAAAERDKAEDIFNALQKQLIDRTHQVDEADRLREQLEIQTDGLLPARVLDDIHTATRLLPSPPHSPTQHSEFQPWWTVAQPAINATTAQHATDAASRETERAEVNALAHRINELECERDDLQNDLQAATHWLDKHTPQVTALAQSLDAIATELLSCDDLPSHIQAAQTEHETHRPAHQQFLQLQPLVDDLPARETQRSEASTHRDQLADALHAATTARDDALATTSPNQLADLTESILRLTATHAQHTADEKHLTAEHARQTTRLAEWTAARDQHTQRLAELAHHQAAAHILKHARSVLRDSAPIVARQLCTRIARGAQSIYNQIHRDPIECSWDPKNFQLEILPGKRRFAMLSGGEQTKLALAMTLAMIRELCDLRLAIFDEPTYGVDATSRPLLADAILATREAAGLDQLLLVSHDDAFDGKTDCTILLTKTSTAGSSILKQD